MPDDAGRLNVRVSPAVCGSDKKPMLRLDLTARGPVKGRELSEVANWIDLGHEWVVRGFASLTRSEMHRVWERKQ
jgi:hypothetical protein